MQDAADWVKCRHREKLEHGVTHIGPDDLGTIYAPPTDRVIAKQLPRIDRHAAHFIGMSPFCVLATSQGRTAPSMLRRAAAIPASSISKARRAC